MTVEGIKTIFDWFAVILLFLTFFAAAGVLITGNIINKRQAQQLLKFDADLTGAKTELGKQQERAANADARVAGLETDAANAKAEMAKQQERAALAEKALLELQERNKPRLLTEGQAATIVAKLKSFASVKLNIFAYDGDPEILAITNQLITILDKSGWKLSVSHGNEVGRAVKGVLIEEDRKSDQLSQSASLALISALASEQLAVFGPQEFKGQPGGMSVGGQDHTAFIWMTIGKKP